MAAFFYLLVSEEARQRTYVGWTLDVARRLSQHNSGKGARFTRGRRWRLVHVEAFETPPDAMRREVALKRDRRARRELAQRGATGL